VTPKLRALLVVVGTVTLVGGTIRLAVPRRDVTRVQLIDGGIAEGQAFVLVCPERLSDKARAAINAAQPGLLRPNQRYAKVARVAACFRPETAGGCFTAAGVLRPEAVGGFVVVPSLRKTNGGSAINDPDADDGLPLEGECRARRCTDMTANFCDNPLRLAAVPSGGAAGCAIPDCRRPDGGWNDAHAPVACRATGVLGLPDGGPLWRGCNVINPATLATGAACLPVECGTWGGDRLTAEFE
jgi:hypothetical protein